MRNFRAPKSLTLFALFAASVAGAGCGGSSSIAPTVTPTAINLALWVANGKNVLEIIPSQAGVSDPVPHITLDSATFVAPQGVQFDANGDLWVLDGGCRAIEASQCSSKGSLDEFTPAQLAAHETTPNPTPNKTIVYPGIEVPQQGVFDSNGDLWVADNRANEVVEFTPAQLAAGGKLVPNLTLTSTPAFDGPIGIAFSPLTGNLWVANNGGSSLYDFAAASLAGLTGTRTLAPQHTIQNNDNSIPAPWALVFDAAGNLWSSNSNSPFTIVEFASTELDGGGVSMPVPKITISPTLDGPNTTLNAPNGLAFDNLGGLWAVNSGSTPGIPLFAAWQLTVSGPTIPSIFLVGASTTLNAPAGDVFGPDVQ
jgi:sugar lactone lactonase YvrE